jgi:outer membrane protein assembly factor BamD
MSSIAAAALLSVAVRDAKAQMPGGGGGFGDPSRSKDKDDKSEVLPEVDAKIGNSAQATFDHAEQAYKKKEWLEAIAYYQHVRAKFSYNVALASLAQLRLGDVAFGREKWLEAKEYYKQFVKMHPSHEKADYASFQIGLCAYKDIPGDFFLFPSTSERDQSEVRQARNTMQDFITAHPHSDYVAQAKEILVKCEDRLADHELYVAHYYRERGKWAGVVVRAEGLARNYPESTMVPESLLLAIQAHGQLRRDAKKAKNTDDVSRHTDAAQKDFDALAALHPPERLLVQGRRALSAE